MLAIPAPEPREVFWRGAEIRGLPPADNGDTASTLCSDMLLRLEAMEAALLSSTSPSSDSMEYPRVLRGPGPGPVSLPGVVFRDTLLSFRNWSRKLIWEEALSPSTENIKD